MSSIERWRCDQSLDGGGVGTAGAPAEMLRRAGISARARVVGVAQRSGSARAVLNAQQPELVGVACELDAIAEAELLKDVVEVGLHGPFGDREPVRHLGVAEPERDPAHD